MIIIPASWGYYEDYRVKICKLGKSQGLAHKKHSVTVGSLLLSQLKYHFHREKPHVVPHTKIPSLNALSFRALTAL